MISLSLALGLYWAFLPPSMPPGLKHTVTVLEELVFGGQATTTPGSGKLPLQSARSTGWNLDEPLQSGHGTKGGVCRGYQGGSDWAGETGLGRRTLYEAKAVILANGAKRRKLDVPWEGTLSGKGVSYCATCDGAFTGQGYRHRRRGNLRPWRALFLANNCETVHLIHRRDSFRGGKSSPMRSSPARTSSSTTIPSPPRSSGRHSGRAFHLQRENRRRRDHPVSGVFVAVGLAPDNHLVEGQLELENGYVKAGEDCATNLPGSLWLGTPAPKRSVRSSPQPATARWPRSTPPPYLQFGGGIIPHLPAKTGIGG